MSSKTRPYEQFGPYILFKKLESDPLGDLWRAARIDDRHLGPLVALRRLTGGDRAALLQNVTDIRSLTPMLEGTSFVKGQVVDSVDGVPYLAHEYGGGRSLRHIVDRARGGSGVTPNPIPLDQAIVIAEKIAQSLHAVSELKSGSTRLTHGALLPQFVWITDDGDVRVAGQQLGKGLVASLRDGKVAAAFARYLSPEYQHSGEPGRASEVFSAGAIFYLLVTSHEPPDAASVSAFSQSVRAAKTMTGQPLPDDIRAILDKSMCIDPSRRFEGPADFKQALAGLVSSGKYAATTFNLAFYLSTLLKKEIEGETVDREKESKVNIVPYLESVLAAPVSAPPPVEKRSRLNPVVPIAAVLALGALGGGAYYVMRPVAAQPVVRQARKTTPPPPVIPARAPAAAPLVQVTPAKTTTVDPDAEKKAFEAAVDQKMQEEMAKLQASFNKQMQQNKRADPRPVQTASAVVPQRPAPAVEDHAPSAASLDEQTLAATRRDTQTQTQQQPAIQPPPVQQQQTQPVPQVAQTSAPAPAVEAPAIHEGDVVDFDQLDVRPRALSSPELIYPAVAKQENIEASLILTVFVSETGRVLDVKVLRGDKRFGFEDEAIRALRGMRFSPGIKDGKRVKTWMPQPVQFKLR